MAESERGVTVATAVAEATEGLTELSHDELRAAAEALARSPADVERLVRLAKLASKAAELRVAGGPGSAYHY